MVQNAWEKISGNLDFVENNNFIRESTEAAIRGFSGINSQKNILDRILLYQPHPQSNLKKSFSPSSYSEKMRWGRGCYYIKFTGLKPVSLLQ